MFDGNFRSRRREVNLSGDNRRTGGNNKRDLLKNAEVQRKQRQERLRRQKASKIIQRVTRGHLSRLRTIQVCVSNVSLAGSENDHYVASNLDIWRIQNRMAALSICLCYNSLLTKFDTTRRDLLLGFHRNAYHPESTGENNYNSSNHGPKKKDIEFGATINNNDLQVMEIDQQDVVGENCTWFSQKRVIRHTLEEFSPHCNDARDTNQELYQLLNTYRESTQMDDRLFLELATCMEKWCLFVDDEQKKQNYENNADGSGNDDSLSSEPSNKEYPREYSIMLSRWAIEASAVLKNTNSEALLATILLCRSNKLTPQDGCNRMPEIPDALDIKAGGKEFEKWFTALTNILCRENIDEHLRDKNGDRDILLQATMANLQNRQVQKLLSNLLDLTKSPRLNLLINHILRQPQNAGLKLIVSLLARGDSIAGQHQQNEESFSAKDGIHNKTNWDDVEDAESEEDDFDNRPSSYKKARGGSTQCKRQEILTMVKLDRYFSERIQQAINKYKHAFDASTIEVATKTIKAPWKEWGLYILGEGTNQEAVGINNNVSHIDKVEADCYVENLGYLLQASSSMRLVTRFTPLSPLAFNPTILSTLWNIIRNEGQRGHILSIFSDLFSHYMLALSDEDFIKYHCNNDSAVEFGNRINAKDLVTRYGQELHALYWTKPVVCSEIHMDSVRGRLIMSGTKLWNSLYERWNRLVNITFCEESAWWFPPMGSKEGDGAVLPDRQLGNGEREGDDDDNDSMDIDEDRNQLSTAEAATDALADSFRDPKMARVLTSVPQALPFDRRVKLFHSLLKADKQKVVQAYSSRRALIAMRGLVDDEGEMMMWLDGSIREQIKIKRASLYRDSMEKLNKLGTKLKHKIQVTFINKHGSEEPGIDGGGVFKEFLDDLIRDGFASANEDESDGGAPRLFSITTKQQQLTMNLDLTEDENMLIHYEFLGRVLGKAVYESILVEPQFCLPFLNQLLGKVNTLEDLKNYDEEYYNNLNKLRHYTEEEIDSLGLTFELTVRNTSSKSTHRTINLVRSGRSIAVTKKNAFQYCQAVANELLNVLGARQTRAFLRGFRDLIKVAWVRLFSAKELQKLISGDDSIRGIDVASLRKSVQYLGGYHESQPYIQDFWDILENELSPGQQRKFLRFMTSCSRQPLLGFSSLEPFPAIQQIRLQSNELSKNSRLPTSSTCMNLLKLPNYQDRKLLKEKLLAAVESGAGFELT